MSSRALLIFARTPEAEASAKRLPLATAAPLFRAVLKCWIASAIAAGATPIIACSGEDRRRLADFATCIEQRGAAFGERLANAVEDARKLGFESVILTGIDAPPCALETAFALLENGADVVAPSRDGGVNLIGVQSLEFLRTIRLRESHLLQRCRRSFRALFVLSTASDIDSMADIAAARREQAWSGYRALLARCLAHASNAAALERPAVTPPLRFSVSRAPPLTR